MVSAVMGRSELDIIPDEDKTASIEANLTFCWQLLSVETNINNRVDQVEMVDYHDELSETFRFRMAELIRPPMMISKRPIVYNQPILMIGLIGTRSSDN